MVSSPAVPTSSSWPHPGLPEAPAPWDVRGDGYLMLWRMPKDATAADPFAPPALQGRYEGSYSVVIIVQYADTPVGPYGEIIYAPGAYRFFDDKTYHSITKIYVTSMASVVNGRANWGIPKEMCTLDVKEEKPGLQSFTFGSDGTPFAEVKMRSYAPGIPLNSAILPGSMLRYAQLFDGKCFGFDFRISGTARLARVLESRFDPTRFPDLSRGTMIGGMRISGFRMHLPVPAMLPTAG